MTPNTIDPAAISAARERVVVALMLAREKGESLTAVHTADLHLVVTALAARDEASSIPTTDPHERCHNCGHERGGHDPVIREPCSIRGCTCAAFRPRVMDR